jgi:hemerythrin-like domain-containing protein
MEDIMEYASSDLIHEHEAILFSLKVLEEMSRRVKTGEQIPLSDITAIIDFLKLFADKCHHGKEEGILFPVLEAAGIPKHDGPIGVMLSEHQAGRGYIKQMQEYAVCIPLDRNAFTEAADSYITLLRAHIDKESRVLFPMGDAKLSEAKHRELLKAFDEFEENVIGKGKHEELHKQLHEFNIKYLK